MIARIRAVDAIRAIAAIVVVIHHCYQSLPPAQSTAVRQLLSWTPLRIVTYGRPVVLVFFVISGFVLATSLSKSVGSYPQFLVRRFFRLYPAFLAAILFSIGLYSLLQPRGLVDMSPWFNGTWGDGIGWNIIAGHLLLLGRAQDASLDNVIWSLVYELRISIVFPVLLLIFRGLGLAWTVLVSALFAGLIDVALYASGIPLAPYYGDGPWSSLLVTAHFLPFFMGGLCVAMRADQIRSSLKELSGWTKLGLWALAIGLLAISELGDLPIAAGSILLLALSLDARVETLLDKPVLLWVGRRSYSLYLVHLPIVIAATYLLHAIFAPWLIVVVALPVVFLATTLCYRLVEAPCVEFGHLLSLRKRELPG